jgi:hypothetical protein
MSVGMQIERKQMKLGGAIFTFIFFYGSRNKNKNSKTKMKVGIVETRYRAVTKRTPLIMQKKTQAFKQANKKRRARSISSRPVG